MPRKEPIPTAVLNGLQFLRKLGITRHMTDRAEVLHDLQFFYSPEVAADWLAAHPDRFMEALEAVGKRMGSVQE